MRIGLPMLDAANKHVPCSENIVRMRLPLPIPLRDARIEVSKIQRNRVTTRAFYEAAFQLDELTVSLRLVARLPNQG